MVGTPQEDRCQLVPPRDMCSFQPSRAHRLRRHSQGPRATGPQDWLRSRGRRHLSVSRTDSIRARLGEFAPRRRRSMAPNERRGDEANGRHATGEAKPAMGARPLTSIGRCRGRFRGMGGCWVACVLRRCGCIRVDGSTLGGKACSSHPPRADRESAGRLDARTPAGDEWSIACFDSGLPVGTCDAAWFRAAESPVSRRRRRISRPRVCEVSGASRRT